MARVPTSTVSDTSCEIHERFGSHSNLAINSNSSAPQVTSMHHSVDPRNASHHHNQAAPLETRRVFSGKVTKILDTFGFIDGDVFFQPSVVRGGQAKVGDSVYVECQYSEHLPFKWNATRVQIIPPQESAASTGNKQPPVVSSSYVPQTGVGMTSPMSHGSSTGPISSRDDPRQSTGNNYWQSGSAGSASNAAPSFAGASRNPLFVSEYTQQPQESGNSGPPPHHFQSGIQAQSVPQQAFSGNNTFQNAPIGNGNSVTFTTTPGSAFLTSQIQPQFDPSVSIGPPGQFPGGPPQHPGPQHSGPQHSGPQHAGAQHSGPPPPARENRASRWEPREVRSSGPIHRDSDDRRRHDRRDLRIDRDRKDGKDEFGRDRPPPESRNARFNERQRDKSLSPGSNTGSVSSRYDSKSDNLPKFHLLPSSISALDIRSRYGSKIHIPSDFETLLINSDFEMDLNSIPKPIRYKIYETKKRKDSSGKKSSEKDKDKDKDRDKDKDKEKDKDKDRDKDKDKERDLKVNREDKKSTEQPSECGENQDKMECTESVSKVEDENVAVEPSKEQESTEAVEKSSVESSDQKTERVDSQDKEIVAPETKVKSESGDITTVKYNGPKNGVKVILLSLPEMNAIYEKVFGYDFERQSSSGYHYPLNKLISFLVFRNQNDGYSLIGGKFNPQLDGLVNDRPNLIATAIRCVKEQTGIDLTPCSRWASLASFVYNRDDSLNERPHVEYSTIFMPDIWTILDPASIPTPTEDKKVVKQEPNPAPASAPAPAVNENENVDMVKCEPQIESEDKTASELMEITSEASQELEKLDELKVVELKSKLDELGVKYPRTLKKAELVSLLREHLSEQIKSENEASSQVDTPQVDQAVETPSSASPTPDLAKRKIESDIDPQPTADDEPPSKKALTEEQAITTDQTKETAADQPNAPESSDQIATTSEKELIKEKIIDVNGEFSFTLLTLHQGLNHHKHDHFELSICAELLRESLVRSFGHFIASALNENSSNLSTSITESPSIDRRKVRAPNYLQLVFAYFDERHIGALSSDDVLPLLIHSGYKISRKSWLSLISNCDKIQYKNLNIPSSITKPPPAASPLNEQIKTSSSSSLSPSASSATSASSSACSSVIVKDGIVYNCENLIKQADKFAKAQIQLQDLTQKLEERERQLSDFETRQKKMTSAIEKQNDEICALKRERELLKNKLEEQRKVWNSIRDSFKKGEELFQS